MMYLKLIFSVCFLVVSVTWAIGINGDLPEAGLVAEGHKDWQQAVSIYLDFLEKNPNHADVWIRIGIIEHQLKNYSTAIDAYQHALKLEPKNASTHKTLSEIYSELNQSEPAFKEINEAVKYQPNNISYLMARIKIANWNKDLITALESSQRILSLNEKSTQNFKPLAILIQIASLQTQLHQYPEAIATYQKVLSIQPNNTEAYYHLSQIYSELKQPNKAMEAIDQALKIEPHRLTLITQKSMLSSWLSTNKRLTLPPKSPFEKALYLANEEASHHHYQSAAKFIQQAIKMKPNDASLYKQLSEIYASAKLPLKALTAINKAVLLSPRNIEYWRARAKLAAWTNNQNLMLDSYSRILQLKPYDEDAMLNLAHTLAWQGRTDDAIKAYRKFLQIYPRNAEGWIQYAETESWTGNYLTALYALQRYKLLKGETFEYLAVKARVLSLIGRFQKALAINETLLKSKPKDPYLLSTEVTAEAKANQINKAVYYLNKINRINATDKQLTDIKNLTTTPLRSNFNLESDYTGATDTTRILDIPITGQYFLSPSTSLLFWGLYERASAAATSPFVPVTGGTAIDDESAMLGISTQLNGFNLKGLLGALHIQNENNHGIYDALVNTNLNDTAQLTIENLRNLYRPYLVPQTPKSISLQIMETRIGSYFQWQPFVQQYLNMVISYSKLSDDNNYLHVNVWPKSRVYASEHWLVTLGINGDFWHYAKRPTNGYYSPLHFNGYEGTIELYYAQTENIGYSFSAGFGLQKDETFPHYYYEEDLAMRLFFGIFTDWELQVKGGFTLRDNPTNNYDCWTIGAILTRRFN